MNANNYAAVIREAKEENRRNYENGLIPYEEYKFRDKHILGF